MYVKSHHRPLLNNLSATEVNGQSTHCNALCEVAGVPFLIVNSTPSHTQFMINDIAI